MNLDGPTDRSRQDGILVVVEPHGAGLRHTRPCSPLVREQWSSGLGRCGTRRRNRHRARDAAARLRTSPRLSCRPLRDGGAPWHRPRTCPKARRSIRQGF
jgi:hypothetical protein